MNIQGELKGDKLTLTIDVSKASRDQAVPSSTGKTYLVASTRGKIRFGDIDIMLNACVPAPVVTKTA